MDSPSVESQANRSPPSGGAGDWIGVTELNMSGRRPQGRAVLALLTKEEQLRRALEGWQRRRSKSGGCLGGE